MKNVILFLLCAMTSQAFAASPNFEQRVGTIPCKKQVREMVGSHLAKQTWFPSLISEPGRPMVDGIEFRDTVKNKAYRIWTGKDTATFLTADIDKKTETLAVFDRLKACVSTSVTQEIHQAPVPAQGFTDQDLHSLMAKHPWGVIYVWTPYMPLSVQALKEIKTAVHAKGGYLTVLLDGKANLGEAKKWMNKGKVSSDELTAVASQELIARKIGLHYPIALIYEKGFLSNRTYIGHKWAKVYEKWIGLEREQMRKDMEE